MIHTLLQCSHASVGLAQARPNYLTLPCTDESARCFTTEQVAIINGTQSLLLCIRKREECGGEERGRKEERSKKMERWRDGMEKEKETLEIR